MMRMTDALREIVASNSLLQMGIRHRLFNLTQLAAFIHRQVEARVKKQVQLSAIVMGLSRLQRSVSKRVTRLRSDFRIFNVAIHSDLLAVTYSKTKEVHKGTGDVYNRIQKKGEYITLTEGGNEITLIVEKKNAALVAELIPAAPLQKSQRIASVGVQFDKRYTEVPGFLYTVLQQLYFQNINIIELASTATELILYVDQDDVRLAFDTLYNRFTAAAK